MNKVGSLPVVRADSPEVGSNVGADSFLRFQGLERLAVIMTDPGAGSGQGDGKEGWIEV